MAELGDPFFLDLERFFLRFAKTEGFWEGNSIILHSKKIQGHTIFFTDFGKKWF